MRIKGKITSWNEGKGFGFITPIAGGRRVFVHISAFSKRNRRPEINQPVTYTLSSDRQGRPCAAKATLAGDRVPQKPRQKSGLLSLTAAATFLAAVGVSVLLSEIPLLILEIYVIASLFTFIAYAMDKLAARNGSWRTQESTLHLLSLAGGWPGALIAQQKLRHKSKKPSFRSLFWLTVCLNGGAFLWLFTPKGAEMLRSLMASFA